jgi:dTDP-D-glucose 4,6-dehydratase
MNVLLQGGLGNTMFQWAFGWASSTPLGEGLRKTVGWYQQSV